MNYTTEDKPAEAPEPEAPESSEETETAEETVDPEAAE